jgi:hypothetical protein
MANAQRTIVKKITLGVPVRKVTGAQAQGIEDLINVEDEPANISPGVLLQYNENTTKYEPRDDLTGITIYGGTF